MLLAAGCLIALFVAYRVGERVGQRSTFQEMRGELRDVQTMLAFNRILVERKLQRFISKGCIAQAADEIDFLSDGDTGQIAEYLKGPTDKVTLKYITDRDPFLIDQLRNYKSKYGTTRVEPVCTPP